MIDLGSLFSQGDVFEWRKAVVSLLLAFGLGQGVAFAYIVTFRGLSYSRTVVQSMAIGSIVTCMLMLAVGNSILAGIGIAAGLTAVRFRTTLRDPRDVLFVFASLAVGIACGAQAFGAAIAGSALFAGASVLLHATGYGSRNQPDGLLRFVVPAGVGTEESITKILREHCRSFSLVTLREAAQGSVMEHAYQVSVREPELRHALVSKLQTIPGMQDVTFLLQEPTLEL